MSEADDLAAAWEGWNRHPGSEARSVRLEDECRKVAAAHGTTVLRVRLAVVEKLADGEGVQAAVAAALETL